MARLEPPKLLAVTENNPTHLNTSLMGWLSGLVTTQLIQQRICGFTATPYSLEPTPISNKSHSQVLSSRCTLPAVDNNASAKH